MKKHVTLVDLKFETLTFKIGDLLEPDLAIKHKSDNFLLSLPGSDDDEIRNRT